MIELRSDTKTRPVEAMRAAMAAAEVGDEQAFEDPCVEALCERVAELFGMERAVFLPSGTMCNQIAAAVHCRPGDEIIAERTAHILGVEGAGASVLARASVYPLDGERGVFTAEQLEEAIRPASRYAPRSRLVAVEQTANLAGGTVWPLATLRAVADVAKAHDLILHMDGARVLNAAVAAAIPARDHAQGFDSAWIDLSKGLGCPVGAVLAGPEAFIDEAWRWKQRIGGAMRQAGMLAAAGLYALDHHVERLAEDHANARLLADRLAGLNAIAVAPETVETNIVLIGVADTGVDAHGWSARLKEQGVAINAIDARTLRAVTHLDVTRADVIEAADTFAALARAEAAE